MSATTGVKRDRINLRLKHNVKKVLERAASFEGKTVSNFILTSAQVRAEKTIQEHEMMSLIARDSTLAGKLRAEHGRGFSSGTWAICSALWKYSPPRRLSPLCGYN
ncbi:DUF1778 domain-containing protein [Microbulbifer sp.]|uniref:type II toxin-antitoxin system TacA family antitoxin n=1 Tax=Microbulbifer sp. TaxID=1908541 RepID=UPI003F2F6A16